MRFGNLTPSIIIVVGLLGATTVSASNDNKVLSGSERRVIDGSLEPEKIYDYFKYGSLIRGYELRVRGHLADRLSFEDQEVLSKLAVQDPIEQAAVSEGYKQARTHLCANRGNMTPVEIARQWSQLALDWRLKNEARYRRGIESLSAEGRQIVEDYVATEIVPGIRMAVPGDSVEFAREHPEEFMEAVESECYFAENGRFPPDEERLYEEFEKALKEEQRTVRVARRS